MKTEDGPAHVRGWIEVSESGAALVLRIGGELDAASRVSIEPEVIAATGSAGSVVIDLEALTFCDSSGVAMFIAAQTNATARATALAIRNLRPAVRRVFEIAGIDSLIELVD